MELKALIQSKRHEELLGTLKKIVPDIDRTIGSLHHKELLQAFNKIIPVNGTPETVKAIGELGKKIELFVSAIKQIPAPSVKVEPAKVFFDTNKLNQLAHDILDSLNEIKNKPVATQWVHEVVRSRDGLISKITSKAIFKK